MLEQAQMEQYLCRRIRQVHSVGVFNGGSPFDYAMTLFLFDAIFIIVLVRLVHFLLKPLRQPRVVAELIAGLIVGPSVLGRNKQFTHKVFPDNMQYVISNIGTLGATFFFFLLGVKMDIFSLAKMGKKHLWVAMVGVIVPMLSGGVVGIITKSSMDEGLRKSSGFPAVSANMAVTSFPVLYIILKEMNLLSSEMGRLALTSSLISDIFGVWTLMVFESIKQAESGGQNALFYTVSVIVTMAFILIVIRKALYLIIKRTPEGRPISQSWVVLVLLLVLLVAFISDMFGIGLGNGAFWLGLVVPDGPPLGSALSERIETMVIEFMMPLAFAFMGFNANTHAFATHGWSALAPLAAIVLTNFVMKVLSTFGAALYFKVPFRDSIVLGLMMNLRGQVEAIIVLHFYAKQVFNEATYTLMLLLIIGTTGVCAPLINILYDPSRPYMVNKRRTIQHTPRDSPLRVVACVQQENDLATIINLLDISYPSVTSPISVFAIHLVELMGRANPLFFDHDQLDGQVGSYSEFNNVYRTLEIYQAARAESVELHWYTAMTVKRTMYQDICKLALNQKTSLILLPFYTTAFTTVPAGKDKGSGSGSQTLYNCVLRNAPCSVGLVVDKSHDRVALPTSTTSWEPMRRFLVLFLGGADSREALAFADRMATNPEVFVMVVRFLSLDGKGDISTEKKLDDGVVKWFWEKNERNERVGYREVVVQNGEETMSAIQALNDGSYELWIVGREKGVNPVIIDGLSSWSDQNPEQLGIIGDFISSADFGGSASVLVVQQQIMRDQGIIKSSSSKGIVGNFLSAIRRKGHRTLNFGGMV